MTTPEAPQKAARRAQSKGNAAFFDGKYEEAIAEYSEAINLEPGNHLAHSNRSACYLQLERYEEAFEDSSRCIQMNPYFVKGYSRQAAALVAMSRFEEARQSLITGG